MGEGRDGDPTRTMTLPGPKTAGVILLALASLASSASLLRHTPAAARSRAGGDEISVYLERFEGLRRILPKHAVVGYEADSENPLDDRAEVRRFYLTQYAVAPVIVVAGTDQDLVIGNYRDPAQCRICRSERFVLHDDLGDGLMLFRKVDR